MLYLYIVYIIILYIYICYVHLYTFVYTYVYIYIHIVKMYLYSGVFLLLDLAARTARFVSAAQVFVEMFPHDYRWQLMAWFPSDLSPWHPMTSGRPACHNHHGKLRGRLAGVFEVEIWKSGISGAVEKQRQPVSDHLFLTGAKGRKWGNDR